MIYIYIISKMFSNYFGISSGSSGSWIHLRDHDWPWLSDHQDAAAVRPPFDWPRCGQVTMQGPCKDITLYPRRGALYCTHLYPWSHESRVAIWHWKRTTQLRLLRLLRHQVLALILQGGRRAPSGSLSIALEVPDSYSQKCKPSARNGHSQGGSRRFKEGWKPLFVWPVQPLRWDVLGQAAEVLAQVLHKRSSEQFQSTLAIAWFLPRIAGCGSKI